MAALIWAIVVVLVVLWLLALGFHIGGALTFLLLVLAVAGAIYNLLEGRIYGGTRRDQQTTEVTEIHRKL